MFTIKLEHQQRERSVCGVYWSDSSEIECDQDNLHFRWQPEVPWHGVEYVNNLDTSNDNISQNCQKIQETCLKRVTNINQYECNIEEQSVQTP